MISVGIDIVNIATIKRIIGNADLLKKQSVLNSVFTKREIKHCALFKNSYKHYAVRFAGKESFFKALGTGLRKGFLFSDIEFLNNEDGSPYVVCYRKLKEEIVRKKIKRINVSFSHSRENAIAIIILEQ